MDENERLEPVLNPEQSRIKSVHKLLHPKPEISGVPKSQLLDKVKNFLPQMAEAESTLNTALRNGEAEQFNIENVEQDDRVIEMDVALLRNNSEEWTSDSEADSTPSETDNNDYTSDSDISSSSTCSSSSCSDKEDKSKSQNSRTEKRPLIEEIDSPQPSKVAREDVS